MPHTHWADDVCCIHKTKAACDAIVRTRREARKEAYDAEQVRRAATKKADQIARIDAFIASEDARMKRLAEEDRPR